ncbi:hypothetical protein CYJ78_12235, partial [Lactobacillus crispatus]
FFVQTNHTRKELLFLMFKEINLRNHSSLHKLFYSLFNTPSNAEMADKTRKTICKYIGTCFTTHLKFICCVFIV